MRPKYLVTILVLLALAPPASSAHAGGVVGVCDEAHLLVALAGGGTVTFGCSGTITLTAEIAVVADTIIDGGGQNVTISGNHAVRVFRVNSGFTLNLNSLTVTNGNVANYGGGIFNDSGTVTVSNSTFAGNNGGTGGGGILNGGTLIVSNSTFAGNSAGSGGGILSDYGMLTVSNSTFAGNSATTYNGGGIFNVGGTAMVSNSTIAGNSANNQGGGIFNNGTLTLKNTIVANSPTGGNCVGNITDGGGNLSYSDTTCPGINGDPRLGPLQNNGGPTETMALLESSAALGAANDATCAAPPVNNSDQRGIRRPQRSHCDIGAIEELCPNFAPPTTVGVEDIQAIVARWGWTNSTPGWDPAYDFNGDNRIDMVDIMLVTPAWGTTCS